ncbi:MAG: septum formation protein Maf [Lachnospiraceae bacterium]|nr:septum formation protein Maf [Lachnospiraceae bacterium]
MSKFILASQSPRRRELFAMLDLPFEILVSDTEEVITSSEPAEVTEELSRQKAEAVAGKVDKGIIIGADTVVSVEEKILGKPADRDEAFQMIQSLQGRSHMVYTGVTILVKENGKRESKTFSVGTKVHVAVMGGEEIRAYISTEEPYDKAGGYGIQGIFGKYIEGIEGDYFNVVGLPVHRLYEELNKMKEGGLL